MNCIYCGGDTQVVNSRPQKRLNHVWRRRKCMVCEAVMTTHEAPAYEDAWRVKSMHAGLKPFNRNKLLLSLHKSVAHRPTALSDAEGLLDTIITKLQPKTVQGVLNSADIIEISLLVLSNFDKPAATSYAAFHPIKNKD